MLCIWVFSRKSGRKGKKEIGGGGMMHVKDDTLSAQMHSLYIKILSLKSLILMFELEFWLFVILNLNS